MSRSWHQAMLLALIGCSDRDTSPTGDGGAGSFGTIAVTSRALTRAP